MKKGFLFFGLIGLLLLTACGKKDITNYVDVSFSGVDSVGKANYTIDDDTLLKDVFKFDPKSDFPDEKTLEEIDAVMGAYKVKVEPETGLSNGDKVTVTVSVDDKQTKKIKGGKQDFTVEGLEEAKDVAEYITMSFSGLNSQGKAEYELNEGELIADIFGQDEMDEETEEAIDQLKTAYSLEVSEEEGLSNGDKVTVKVNVDKDKTKLIKNGEKEFTVKDLGEASELTTKDVEKHLIVNFNGVSGKGVAKIDNTLSSPLDYFDFQIENDGELKNGDEATLLWDEDMEQRLNDSDYIVAEDFKPVFKVEGLDVVAEKAKDIKNLDDIKRMLKEALNRRYETMAPDQEYGRVYKMKEEKVLYRQFDTGSNDTDFILETPKASNHGNLIGIYTVEKHSGGSNSKLEEKFTAVVGYSGIVIDDKNKTNVTEMELFHDERDDTYSLDSVIQLYEGYGYTEVKD